MPADKTKPPVVIKSSLHSGWVPMQQEAHLVRFRGDQEQEDAAELEMTPMIDITTLLLIFFLVSGVFMLQARIPLPEAKTGTPLLETEQKPVTIAFKTDDEGRLVVYFEDEPDVHVEPDDIVQGYSRRLEQHFLPEVVLKADRHIPFKIIRQVMEQLAAAGVEKVDIAVEEPLR